MHCNWIALNFIIQPLPMYTLGPLMAQIRTTHRNISLWIIHNLTQRHLKNSLSLGLSLCKLSWDPHTSLSFHAVESKQHFAIRKDTHIIEF